MKFDKSKVYTALNADEVKVGSKGYFADTIKGLEELVNSENKDYYNTLVEIAPTSEVYRFKRGVDFITEYALFYLVEEPKVDPKTEVKPLSLNEIAKLSYENAEKRENNGGHVSTETRAMLKHCATEVIEATEAYSRLNFEKLVFSAENENKFASELADIICCCTIIAGREGIDLDKAVADCLEKNRKRAEGTGDKK